jgi:hypothetical protein
MTLSPFRSSRTNYEFRYRISQSNAVDPDQIGLQKSYFIHEGLLRSIDTPIGRPYYRISIS